MRYSVVSLALAAVAAAQSQVSTLPGTFEIEVVNVTSVAKRSLEERQSTPLVLTLNNGILKDALGRIGYIAANQQFQFDYAAQPGSPYASGWSVYSNNTLALNGDAVFDKCLSGMFYNLYDASIGGQCSQIFFEVINQSAGTTGTVVSVQSDGQPTGNPVTQISDGQPQGPTGTPITQISDGQPQAPTGTPVTQISDGQPQAPTGTPVTQISDGQPQAPTGTPVTQISDGQPQAPAATSTTLKPRPTGTIGTVSQKPSSTPTVTPYQGAAVATAVGGAFLGLAAGVLAAAALL